MWPAGGGGGGSLQHEDVRISQNINRPHGQWRGCDESRAVCLESVTRVTVTWPRDTESVMLSRNVSHCAKCLEFSVTL